MANISISATCNQDCEYCFAIDHPGDQAGGQFMPLALFESCLDFLERSGIEQARLLGGEPTLHPQFAEIVSMAVERHKRLLIFSNGLIPEKALSALEALPSERCMVLINVADPQDVPPRVHERRLQVMRRLGGRAIPGFNIYRPDFSLQFIPPLIEEVGCKPVMRLGLAHPCLSANNRHLHPRYYPFVGEKIARFAQRTACDVMVEFDCGFVRCMFSEKDYEILKTNGDGLDRRCNPILDVDIEGKALHCYPLANFLSFPLTAESAAAALRQTFEARTAPYRQAGIFAECSTCIFKARRECTGGCLSTTMQRFRRAAFQLQVPQRSFQ